MMTQDRNTNRCAVCSMAKFDGIIEKRLLTVTEKENELTLVFEDNRYLFVSLKDGRVVSESVPE